jgi:hypothetical protein
MPSWGRHEAPASRVSGGFVGKRRPCGIGQEPAERADLGAVRVLGQWCQDFGFGKSTDSLIDRG